MAVHGQPVGGDPAYRAHVGYMPQHARFPENLTGREVIRLLRDLRGDAVPEDDELFESFALGPELDKPVRTLSGGTRQKLNAAVAFMFRPALLVLDEPTAGLDPIASGVLKDKILRARRAGTSIILTSHVLSELQELVDDVVFLLEGRVEFEGLAPAPQRGDRRDPAGACHRQPDAAGVMMTAGKVLRYELRDLRRSRWILGYALLLLLLTDALLRFGGGGPRAVLSLLNVVLVFVPLVSIVFGAMYLYGARDFIELLLAQPVGRSALFAGLYGGLAAPLAAAFVLGVGLPFLWGGGDGSLAGPLAMLLGAGVLLTLVFTALAFLVSLLFEDRAKGLGAALLVWLAATALYDAALVLVAGPSATARSSCR